MKNIKLVFAALLVSASVFTACSKDDDNNNSSISATFEGKWYYSQDGVSAGGQEVLTPYQNECTTNKDYVEFISTGGVYNKVAHTGTDCVSTTNSGTYSRSGSTITLLQNGVTTTEIITSLTDAELKITTTSHGGTYITVYTKN